MGPAGPSHAREFFPGLPGSLFLPREFSQEPQAVGFSELPQFSKLASTKERVLRVAVALFQPNPSVPRSRGRIARALQVTLCLQVQAMNQIGRCC